MGKRARELLQDNARALIGDGRRTTFTAVQKTKLIANGTLGRVLNAAAEGGRLDTLDDLCNALHALGIDAAPWQLLHPSGVEAKPQNLSPMAQDLAALFDEIDSHEVRQALFSNVEGAVIAQRAAAHGSAKSTEPPASTHRAVLPKPTPHRTR